MRQAVSHKNTNQKIKKTKNNNHKKICLNVLINNPMKPITKILILVFAFNLALGLFFLIDFGKVQIVRGVGESCAEDTDCPQGEKCVGAKLTEKEMTFGLCEKAVLSIPESQPTEEGAGGAGGAGREGEKAGKATPPVFQNPLRFQTGSALLSGFLTFLIGGLGLFAVAAIIIGGFMYMTSAGSEERIKLARSILTYAIIGLVVSILAYVIVNTVIRVIGG